MFSTMPNILVEAETLVTSELNRCSIKSSKNPSTSANAQALHTASSVKNAVFLLDEKKDLDKCDIVVPHLANKLAKTAKSDKSCTKITKKNSSLKDALKCSNGQKSSYEKLQESNFNSSFRERMDLNISPNTLAKEIILNTHFARSCLQPIELRMLKSQDWKDKSKNVSKNNFVEQTLVPALDFENRNIKNKKLNLLCVFLNEADYDEASLDIKKIHDGEDITLILPMAWNIVVASNVVTISDENNQHIKMFFRNSLEAKFDYKCSKNLPFRKKFRFYSSMDVINTLKGRAQSDRMRKLNSPGKNIAIKHKVHELLNWRNNRAASKSPKKAGEKKMNDSLLILREPILLKCIEENKTKQVLLYKAHSAQNKSKDSFCKTLEELLDKSIQYKDEPIYLVSEPLKLITRLKREEKVRCLKVENYYTCDHDLTRSPIYRKLLRYKNTQVLKRTEQKNEAFNIILPKNEYAMQGKDRREISGGSTLATDRCLDLPKNFSSLFLMQNMDMDSSAMQETSEMSTTPVTVTHSCLDFTKSSPTFFTGRNFDMNKLFGENKSNILPRRNTTALKHVNAKKIVSSIFRYFFHFYSRLGGNLRSGAVITRSNSNYWLQVAGVATDSFTLKLASDLFTIIAGKKVVLNIFDYIKFLVVFARTKRLIITELMKQMMVCEELSETVYSKEKCKKCRRVKNQESKPKEIYHEGNHLTVSQSLPNIWPPKKNSTVANRNCLSIEAR